MLFRSPTVHRRETTRPSITEKKKAPTTDLLLQSNTQHDGMSSTKEALFFPFYFVFVRFAYCTSLLAIYSCFAHIIFFFFFLKKNLVGSRFAHIFSLAIRNELLQPATEICAPIDFISSYLHIISKTMILNQSYC